MASGEKVVNNLSRFVLIIWVFVVLILTQSYTASLTSMLTVQRLQPSFTDVKEIQRNGLSVGYQNNSFVKDLLTKQLQFDEAKLISLNTQKEFHDALSNGSVAAIFDEIPYINLFLANYCSAYMMTGPTYRTDGFGFVSSFLNRILYLSELRKHFNKQYISECLQFNILMLKSCIYVFCFRLFHKDPR